jgi:hypothetical protein
VVRPWARVGQREVDLDHRVAAVSSLAEDILVPEADSPDLAESSLDPEAGIDVAVEDGHLAVGFDHKRNPKLHAQQAHHETNPGLGLCALVSH